MWWIRLSLLLVICNFFLLASTIQAQDFQTEYRVEYFLNSNDRKDAHVRVAVKITNLESDTALNRYILSFPDKFTVRNINARDDKGSITPTLSRSDGFLSIELYFNDPTQSRNSANTFYIEFDQDNITSYEKKSKKIEIPIVQKQQDSGNYLLIVHTGEPNGILTWNNPKVKLLTFELAIPLTPAHRAAPTGAQSIEKQSISSSVITVAISLTTLILFSTLFLFLRRILHKKPQN